jgi:hypothetical protein
VPLGGAPGAYRKAHRTFVARFMQLDSGGKPQFVDSDRLVIECRPGVATTTTTTTTIATTSTTTTTSSTTTTSFGPPLTPPSSVDLVTTNGGSSVCGATFNASNTKVADLHCGGLDLGGGASKVLENLTPSGATNRFAVTSCNNDLSSCTLGATSAKVGNIDCTNTGCYFGTPLPIPNGGTTSCVINRFAAPVTGTLDLAAGATTDLDIELNSDTFLTGLSAAGQPCPRCVVVGIPSPTNPRTGTCDRGARKTLACVTTNPEGLTQDCQPGGGDGSIHVGVLPISLNPLKTSGLTVTAGSVVSGGGIFCPAQGQSTTQRGAFAAGFPASQTVTKITETGTPAGDMRTFGTAHPVTLASIFCVPLSGNGLVDNQANLPGPGATTIAGTLTANP